MVFSDPTFRFFSLLQSNVRVALAGMPSETPFSYSGESFFKAYEALRRVWVKRQAQRQVAQSLSVSRATLKSWESRFIQNGAMGLLSSLSFVDVDPRIESLVKIVRTARPHANTSSILQLADALELPHVSLETLYRIQRSHGYGQRLDEKEVSFYAELQKIFTSWEHLKSAKRNFGHDPQSRRPTFLDFQRDAFQHRIELFKALNVCTKRGQIRSVLREFGIHSSRFYQLRERYLNYGIWGLIDLAHTFRRIGEKISPELELQIIEERLMNPSLSAKKMIKHLKLKCSRANVQKVYTHWQLPKFKAPKPIRGIVATPPAKVAQADLPVEKSARSRFPDLVKTAGLKVNRGFLSLLERLKYRSLPISNPGAILLAPLLEQLGIVEAIYTYGPPTCRTTEITNDILLNVLRIVVGFPTINSFMLNSDHSVAIAAGLSLKPCKSALYRRIEDFRFCHLERLRNDAGRRAKELDIISGKKIALDYHCDPSDSRYPRDKAISKAPDKNGDLVYAHRPQIIWDSDTHSIINIAYCEGRSRAPSALYKFCETNLFQIIDPSTISEIYADSEYTGEKQLIYLVIRSGATVTMCLKQNKKIKKLKEEVLKQPDWQSYGKHYRLASMDFQLPETGKSLRFVVKQNLETNETRCFGSTHLEWSPTQILDKYHLRWPVENGLKDLVENYFLDHPPGTSPEKIEVHYYCVMIARLLIDYFLSVSCEPKWKTAEGWESVLSTIRTTVFANQNCEISLHESGDLLVTYLSGDPNGLLKNLVAMFDKRKAAGINHVSWWGERGVRIKIEDRFGFDNGPETR